jgi:hypothetical protein
MIGCTYYDYCNNGKKPDQPISQNCEWGDNCYSESIDQATMWIICNDDNYAKHAWFEECGFT